MGDERTVGQELILPVDARYPRDSIASFLTTFADYILGKQRALLRGDVAGPSEPLIPGVKASAVYASIPVLFEPTLATYRGTTPATVVVWVLPLVEPEPRFIKEAGWERFEEELERAHVDLWDLDREPIV